VGSSQDRNKIEKDLGKAGETFLFVEVLPLLHPFSLLSRFWVPRQYQWPRIFSVYHDLASRIYLSSWNQSQHNKQDFGCTAATCLPLTSCTWATQEL